MLPIGMAATPAHSPMRWRVFSIRQAADFPRDGEAALRALPGLGGTGLGGVELAGAGLGGPGLTPSLAEFSAKHGGEKLRFPGSKMREMTRPAMGPVWARLA